MYATFEEAAVNGVQSPAVDQQQPISASQSVPMAPVQHAAETASTIDDAVNPAHVIGALRQFVINNAYAPPPAWRRYRHELPSSVAELQLQPSSVEPVQPMPSSTFAIQLDKEPDTTVSQYCSEVIEYVMTHVSHLNAQSPVISLRFAKVGSIVAQCIVTVGNNDVLLAKQLVANLNEVGLATGFVASKPPPPCATMIVWDVKRGLHRGRGIQAEDIEMLLAPQGPNGRPIPSGVSVVKGFEEGIFYAAMKRPDVVHSWLMNATSSWLFQRELYTKLGVLLLMAPCEHQWAQKRGAQPDVASAPLQQQQQQQLGEGSGDDEEEDEFLGPSSNTIDIFGGVDPFAPTSSATNAVEVPAPAMGPPPQYVSNDFPEIVGDDEELDEGLLTAPVLSSYPPQQLFSHQAEWTGLPMPNGGPSPGQLYYPADTMGGHYHAPYGSLLQAPSHYGNGVLPPVLSYDHHGPTFTSAPLPFAGIESDVSPVPDILMPEELSAHKSADGGVRGSGNDHLGRFVETLENLDPHRIPHALTDQRNRRVIAELVGSTNQTILERLAVLLLQPLPSKQHTTAFLRFRPAPVVLDGCLQDRASTLLPLVVKVTRVSPLFVDALATRLVANLHRYPFRTLTFAVLESDTSLSNPLISELLRDPVQWCVDAAEITRPHLFQFPHLMVPYGANGFRLIFEQCSNEQKDALRRSLRALTSEDVKQVVERAELMGRALIVSALCSGLLDAEWLLERLRRVPEDNKTLALLIDFACVIVHGSRDTLFSEAMLVAAGKYCALVDASPIVAPDWTDDAKVDFLHQFVLRRFFAPAQEKYHILRDTFRSYHADLGAGKGPIAAIFDSSTPWPRKTHQAGPRHPQQGGLLPLPTAAVVVEPAAVVLPTKETTFSWNDQWSDAFLGYPSKGEPFPDPTTTSEDGSDIQRWKWSVSKSYGHYYFKNEEKHSKPSYKHPVTSLTYMVSPQAFVVLEDSQETREKIMEFANVAQSVFDEWMANQRNRSKPLDEAVLSLLKITYREQNSSSSSAKTQSDAHQASRILKSQRDLERKLKFVADLEYPARGHPFPTLPRGWTCSLSAGNGLYYFKRQGSQQQKPQTLYEHPETSREYPPTPQAYAFFEGIKEQKLLEKLAPYGVTLERIQEWMKDQRTRDLDIDYYVVEKIGVRYDKNPKSSKRARSESR